MNTPATIDLTKFTEACRKVFREKFVRTAENIFSNVDAYVAIQGTVLMAQIDCQMRGYGYVCTNLEATAKDAFIIHFRNKFKEED